MPIRCLHKSGVHRAACFALQRALIRQARSSPLDASIVKGSVRSRFRKNSRLQNRAEVKAAFQVGYTTLHLLSQSRRASADTLDFLTSKLTSILRPKRASGISSELSSSRAQTSENGKPPVEPYVGGPSILSRPRPSSALAGKRRRVPRLMTASGVPFLRIKKPQSPVLSRYLKATIRARQRRRDRITALEYFLQLAESENEWDSTLRQRIGAFAVDADPAARQAGWATHLRDAVEWNVQLQIRLSRKNRYMAMRMWNIVQQEQKLARKEKEVRRRKYLMENGNVEGSVGTPLYPL